MVTPSPAPRARAEIVAGLARGVVGTAPWCTPPRRAARSGRGAASGHRGATTSQPWPPVTVADVDHDHRRHGARLGIKALSRPPPLTSTPGQHDDGIDVLAGRPAPGGDAPPGRRWRRPTAAKTRVKHRGNTPAVAHTTCFRPAEAVEGGRGGLARSDTAPSTVLVGVGRSWSSSRWQGKMSCADTVRGRTVKSGVVDSVMRSGSRPGGPPTVSDPACPLLVTPSIGYRPSNDAAVLARRGRAGAGGGGHGGRGGSPAPKPRSWPKAWWRRPRRPPVFRLAFTTDADEIRIRLANSEAVGPGDHDQRNGDLVTREVTPSAYEVSFGAPSRGPGRDLAPQPGPDCRGVRSGITSGARVEPAPAPERRWLAYGSSITQSMHAIEPASTWPAQVARQPPARPGEPGFRQ